MSFNRRYKSGENPDWIFQTDIIGLCSDYTGIGHFQNVLFNPVSVFFIEPP